jgi:hypothetical protein
MDTAVHIHGSTTIVSNEIVKYGREFCRTWTREWLLWQGPEAIVRLNYRPILSSERASHVKKPAIVRQKTKIWSWALDGSLTTGQAGRLTVGRNLTSTPIYSVYGDYRTIGLLEIWIWATVEFAMNQELLWMKHGDSSGTQRKGNVRRWKPLPEDHWRESRPSRFSAYYREL